MDISDLNYKQLHLTETFRVDLQDSGYKVIDIETLDHNRIIAFDRERGLLISIGNDTIVSTGGIGVGPNEFDVEYKPGILICGNTIIAYDLRSPRFMVYDQRLNLINTVLLGALAEEIICYSEEEVAAFYFHEDSIDILTFKGALQKSIPFYEDWDGTNLSFKEAIKLDDTFFIAYIFDPKLIILNENEGIKFLYNLPVLQSDSVRFATKNISRSDSLTHIYFYDDSPHQSDHERKNGHVFTSTGSYLLSYKVPDWFNFYKIIDNNYLIAVEDSLQQIVIYKYHLYE